MLLIFTFHTYCASIVGSLYFRNFWASFLIIFQPPDSAISINVQAIFSLSSIMKSCLSLGMFLSVGTCCFQNTVILPSQILSSKSDSCSHQCPFYTLLLFPCIH
jgi:hypothetical protein